ncbi:VWA domain-containing protein [Paenibacillus sp. N1-5-1-14]|uniref:vWA domain-containing protein n=1 Tax=Paenibacillus radicibacter TaxID=2972488 RepID=UPI002158B6F1|nr:vWA domain-containing protein [Paenibacillus radicibacter]MCR8644712.1 VWA domain-containing protein [Paenibacillus radicibacter]
MLTLFSLVGGVLGFIVGEIMLNQWGGTMHNTLLMGLYYGQFALIVGLSCLLSEVISPELNGNGWKFRYASDGWKLLIPSTLILLFVAGALFQFLYSVQYAKKEVVQDYIVILDKSESMRESDPGKQSIKAAQSLIEKLDDTNRVALYTFNEETQLIFPLTRTADASTKSELVHKLSAMEEPIGKTDIGKALTTAMDDLKKDGAAGHSVAVILISDGYSEVNTSQVLSPYVHDHVRVHTVGIDDTQKEGNKLLQRIAQETGADFYDVKRADRITDAFNIIYDNGNHRHLMNERLGSTADSVFYGVLRVVFILILGMLLGLSLGIIFDNRYLAKSFGIGGAIAGLLAGLVLETGLQGASFPMIYRGLADIILAFVLSLSTLIVAVPERGSNTGLRTGWKDRGGQEKSVARSRDDRPSGRRFR